MSAWMTSDIHRSALVQEAQVRGLVNPAEADRLWQQMTWDNQYALLARYGDELPYETWEDVLCRRQVAEAPLNPWVILKGISCWNYQCMEFHGWDKTAAYLQIKALRQHIEQELSLVSDEYHQDRPEYNDAPWGIDSWTDVVLPQ